MSRAHKKNHEGKKIKSQKEKEAAVPSKPPYFLDKTTINGLDGTRITNIIQKVRTFDGR